jgi:hypothetical protein
MEIKMTTPENRELIKSIERLTKLVNNLVEGMPNPKTDWLKQKEVKPYGRIIMQLMDNANEPISQSRLVDLTGFSNKAVRENLIELSEMSLVRRSTKYSYWETMRIF